MKLLSLTLFSASLMEFIEWLSRDHNNLFYYHSRNYSECLTKWRNIFFLCSVGKCQNKLFYYILLICLFWSIHALVVVGTVKFEPPSVLPSRADVVC